MVSPSRSPRRSTEEVEAVVDLVSEICTQKGVDRHKARTLMSMVRWIGRKKAPPTMGELQKKFGYWGPNSLVPFLMHEGVLKTTDVMRDDRPVMEVDYGKEDK